MILEINNLVKYYGSFKALNQVSLSIPEGSIYGFLGPNGAGKTTTIRSIMGILKADEGNINFFGHKTKTISDKEKRKIGYVSQEQFFYNWMTCKQIGQFVSGFFPSWENEEYDRLLKSFDIPINRKISALSVGMRLKLALALALAHRPKVLILDEPTSGLDPLSRKEFLSIIEQQSKVYGRTTFFSSHIIEEVEKIATDIGIIQKGKILVEDNITTLKNDIRKIRVSQTDEICTLLEQTEIIQKKVSEEFVEYILRIDKASFDKSSHDSLNIELSLEDIFVAYTNSNPTL